jgi:hypothetical protein
MYEFRAEWPYVRNASDRIEMGGAFTAIHMRGEKKGVILGYNALMLTSLHD